MAANIWRKGSWKQSILPRYLKDLCLPDGWPWKVQFQHGAMIVPGDTITVWARVTGKREADGLGLVEHGRRHAASVGVSRAVRERATIVLPIKGGRPIPYPFVPPKEA